MLVMKKTFLNHSNPMLTVMLQCKTPETAIGRIRNANCLGADAYGLQVETLMPEFQNPDTYKKIFTEMQGRPCYVTNYRYAFNQNLTDDELADGIISLAENGATLCDVMGDLFCKHPEELTDNDEAIYKSKCSLLKGCIVWMQKCLCHRIFTNLLLRKKL
ncbi:MAG: hypothetical protein ACLR23_19850 [Clostridia bacterium]